MQKRTVLIGVAVLALVGAGVYLMPDTGNQGFLVNKSFNTQTTKSKSPFDNSKSFYPDSPIQRDLGIDLGDDAQDPEPFAGDDVDPMDGLAEFEALTEDGVRFFRGECLPEGVPGGAVTFDNKNGAGDYVTYEDFVRAMAAEIQDNGGESTRCPYLFEVYSGANFNRPGYSFLCQEAGLTNSGGFRCENGDITHSFGIPNGNYNYSYIMGFKNLESNNISFRDFDFFMHRHVPTDDLRFKVVRVAPGTTL